MTHNRLTASVATLHYNNGSCVDFKQSISLREELFTTETLLLQKIHLRDILLSKIRET